MENSGLHKMAENDQLTSALNLMRRMPPSSVENSLAGLIELVPDLTEELLNHVDQPLKLQMDTKAQRQFILCDYNRDGDSYRYDSTPQPTSHHHSITPSPPPALITVCIVSVSCLYDSYCSSPWSNTYFPPSDDGFVPTAGLRKMEMEANDIFDTYRKLYAKLQPHATRHTPHATHCIPSHDLV